MSAPTTRTSRTRLQRAARTAGVVVQAVLLALAVFLATYRLVRGGSEAATFRYEGF